MFLRPTVNGIIADINKKINQLRDAHEYHNSLVDKHQAWATKHLTDKEEAAKEAGRALFIAQKLTDLVA